MKSLGRGIRRGEVGSGATKFSVSKASAKLLLKYHWEIISPHWMSILYTNLAIYEKNINFFQSLPEGEIYSTGPEKKILND